MELDQHRQTSRRSAASRGRRRSASFALDPLERRDLLAWSPLYASLPDLTVDGIAAPVAAYGQPIAVTVDVRNLGANTFPVYNQEQGAPTTADSPPGRVTVFASSRPRFSTRSVVQVGSFDIPSVKQNSLAQFTRAVTLPRSRKLPADGGTVYLYFRVETPVRPTPDFDLTNNTTRVGVPVQTAPALPDLFGYALDVPPTMQPGDVISPTIQIVNYGTADPGAQGPFDVILVASEDQNFGPGDVVLARTTVTSVAPLSLVPMKDVVLGDVNLFTPLNVETLAATSPITLPNTPDEYFLGVVVDPENRITELSEIGRGPDPVLNPVRRVGPPLHGMPPAGVATTPADPTLVFPYPPFGALDPPVVNIEPPTVDPLEPVDTTTLPDLVVKALAMRKPSATKRPGLAVKPTVGPLRAAQRVVPTFPARLRANNTTS